MVWCWAVQGLMELGYWVSFRVSSIGAHSLKVPLPCYLIILPTGACLMYVYVLRLAVIDTVL